MGSGGTPTLWPPGNRVREYDPHQVVPGGEMGVKIDAVHWLDLLTRPSVYQPRADGGGVELSSANRTISIG